ncbi:MAG: hypothetical protein V3T16_06410 [Gemmatimonadales bacterium]
MRIFKVIPVLAVIALAACNPESQPEPPQLGEVMPIVPLPPEFEPVSITGSDEALQLTFQSPVDQDMMAGYYRRTFAAEPWTLVSDTKASDGADVLYAEVYGSPLWVRITSTPGVPGTTIQLSGAVVNRDSTLIDSLSATGGSDGG